jgi:hypothetical protein
MTAEATLERRYRRLLRLYPTEHRREYEEEMIAVLLAGTAPGRSGPGLGEVLDLVSSALTARWLRGAQGLRDRSWRQAAGAVQLFGAILLLAVGLRRDAMGKAATWYYADFVSPVPVQEFVRPGLWALVLVLALAGWRWAALPAALAGVVAEAVPPIGLYLDTPAALLNAYWMLVAAAVVATASLILAVGGRERRGVPRGTALVAVGGTLVIAGGAATGLGGDGSGLWLGGRLVGLPVLALYATAALLVALGVLRLSPPVRRRVVVMAVPVMVTWPLIPVGFGDLIEHNLRSPQPDLLGPLQWAALVVLPLAAMWVAALLNRRFERDTAGSPSV